MICDKRKVLYKFLCLRPWWQFDWDFARYRIPAKAVVTITSMIISFNIIQNGDILVPAVYLEEMAVKTDICICVDTVICIFFNL